MFATATPGVGGIGDFARWWAEPVVFGKAVIWTLLFEVLGLGCGSGPLTARYLPPLGGALYWLRPGTTRLPPFPRRVPLTAGHRRTAVDVALYVAVIALAVRALLAPRLDAAAVLPLVVALPVIGLRDKTVFLAARSDRGLDRRREDARGTVMVKICLASVGASCGRLGHSSGWRAMTAGSRPARSSGCS